jgi:hypothetical protein
MWHKKVGYIFLGSTEFISNIIRHTQCKIITWDISGQKKTCNNYVKIFFGKTEDNTCVFLVSLRPMLHTSNSRSIGYLNRSVEHTRIVFPLLFMWNEFCRTANLYRALRRNMFSWRLLPVKRDKFPFYSGKDRKLGRIIISLSCYRNQLNKMLYKKWPAGSFANQNMICTHWYSRLQAVGQVHRAAGTQGRRASERTHWTWGPR